MQQFPPVSQLGVISSRIAGQVELFSSDFQACAQTRAGQRAALSVQSAAAAMQHLEQRSASELSAKQAFPVATSRLSELSAKRAVKNALIFLANILCVHVRKSDEMYASPTWCTHAKKKKAQYVSGI